MGIISRCTFFPQTGRRPWTTSIGHCHGVFLPGTGTGRPGTEDLGRSPKQRPHHGPHVGSRGARLEIRLLPVPARQRSRRRPNRRPRHPRRRRLCRQPARLCCCFLLRFFALSSWSPKPGQSTTARPLMEDMPQVSAILGTRWAEKRTLERLEIPPWMMLADARYCSPSVMAWPHE